MGDDVEAVEAEVTAAEEVDVEAEEEVEVFCLDAVVVVCFFIPLPLVLALLLFDLL